LNKQEEYSEMMETEKNKYLFDEYIHGDDPEKRARAENWRVAIGLQAVDRLTVSDYLIQLARRNIEGELSIDEVRELIDVHYKKKK